MNEWEENRREEIKKLWNEQRETYCNFFDVIVLQEKEMIREAYEEGYADAQKGIKSKYDLHKWRWF